MHRPQLFAYILCTIGYLSYGAGMLGFLTLFLPLALLLRPFDRLFYRTTSGVLHTGLALLTRWYLPLLQVYRIREISGFDSVSKGERAIIVANHQGRLDGLLILGLVNRAGALIKARYAANPFYRSLVKTCRFVSVDPQSLQSLQESIEGCRRVLDQGTRLVIFPEGTRSTAARLLPFKELAFRIAMETDTPILPVVIFAQLPFMAKSLASYFPAYRFDYRLRCLEPMSALPGERPGDFAERVRRRMSTELKSINDLYTSQPQGA